MASLLITVFVWSIVASSLLGVVYWWQNQDKFKSTRNTLTSGDDSTEQEPDNDREMISLVFMMKEPRYIDATILSRHCERAWNFEFGGDEEDQRYVLGEPPLMLVRERDWFFTANFFAAPYFENVEEVAALIEELRLRQAVLEHEAWFSIDCVNMPTDEDEATMKEIAYKKIASLMAELSGENCLVLYVPQLSRGFVWNEELCESLRSEQPLEKLNIFPPVIQIEADNELMLQAYDQAQSRWLEFVLAFENRSENDEKFTVKAKFSSDDFSEFMWVIVTALENDVVYGTLGNDPVNLTHLKCDQQVRFASSDVVDWIYIANEEIVGGFTLQAIAEIQKQQKPGQNSGN